MVRCFGANAAHAQIEVLSASGDLVEAAAKFFASLRRLDAAQLELIVATPFPNRGLGRALNDRLSRAARKNAADEAPGQ
jgi:L-threonylcarbamoyladenylate synthase